MKSLQQSITYGSKAERWVARCTSFQRDRLPSSCVQSPPTTVRLPKRHELRALSAPSLSRCARKTPSCSAPILCAIPSATLSKPIPGEVGSPAATLATAPHEDLLCLFISPSNSHLQGVLPTFQPRPTCPCCLWHAILAC
jgi:hypothetical protein